MDAAAIRRTLQERARKARLGAETAPNPYARGMADGLAIAYEDAAGEVQSATAGIVAIDFGEEPTPLFGSEETTQPGENHARSS